MAEFYTNLRILSQDLYKQRSSAPGDNTRVAKLVRQQSGNSRGEMARSPSAALRKTSSFKYDAVPSPSKDYFAAQSMHERMRQYAKEGGIPMEFVERYSQETNRRGSDA